MGASSAEAGPRELIAAGGCWVALLLMVLVPVGLAEANPIPATKIAEGDGVRLSTPGAMTVSLSLDPLAGWTWPRQRTRAQLDAYRGVAQVSIKVIGNVDDPAVTLLRVARLHRIPDLVELDRPSGDSSVIMAEGSDGTELIIVSSRRTAVVAIGRRLAGDESVGFRRLAQDVLFLHG
ncbi:hypothetical protein [Microlunatus parietis]|uniref:Uncharacterized protein n=1 Tax=Microlunatus parietis TaxID=682979 RepID=A0A7Y9LCD5_9ACTN|nr:hypothetical protein [Microlunatus parietis]NYE71595.1 hypothetical protein [Microlunatus parietis]